MASVKDVPTSSSVYQSIPIEESKEIGEIRFTKFISACTLGEYAVLRIFFKKEEDLNAFSGIIFQGLDCMSIKHIDQEHQLEVIFFDPKKNPYNSIDAAISRVFQKYQVIAKKE